MERLITDRVDSVRLALYKGYAATQNGEIIGMSENILSEAIGDNGYKFFGIRLGSKTLNVPSHRFVAAFFHGESVLDAECIRHKNDDKLDNHPDNLEPGTSAQNFQDIDSVWRKDFARRGAHTRRALTDEQVREIKQKLRSGQSQYSLVREYGVANGTIQQIKEGKSYRWIE